MLSPGQGLLRVEALALWHLFGHPPQDTHLDKTDSTFCAKFMIMMHVPSSMSRHQQLETKTKERNPHDQCFNKVHHVVVNLDQNAGTQS